MTTQDDMVQASGKVLIENYGRLPCAVVRGEGSRLWDADGKEYLDFFPGFGGGGVGGHCHPQIVEALREQAGLLWSHGNLLTSAPQIELAEMITGHAFGGKVFFCHSGAEANETALKLVRKAAGEGRYKIISFHGCFHGRTMGGLSLTPESFQKGFEPMLPGAVKATFGDLDSVAAVIDDETAGVFVEAIQVEGGLISGSQEFIRGLRALCDEKGLLLVVDEVWTAPARTGAWFAHQHYGITPDVMTLGKSLGGGAPMAACVAAPPWADVLSPGTHGCTMGGNPLCAAAGVAAMRLIEQQDLVARAASEGERIADVIRQADIPSIREIRGRGLLLGVSLDESVPAKDVMMTCMDRGLILCTAKGNVVRIAPALTIEPDVLDEGIGILLDVLTTR